jgi:hypothetical protein
MKECRHDLLAEVRAFGVFVAVERLVSVSDETDKGVVEPHTSAPTTSGPASRPTPRYSCARFCPVFDA